MPVLRFLPFLALLTACAPAIATVPGTPGPNTDGTHTSPAREDTDHATTGVLVMAHGGDSSWNRSVEESVTPLREELPVEIAWGMADPGSLRSALGRLEARGVRNVAVVRVFLSGASFYDQTAWYLGLDDIPPASFVLMGPSAGDPQARRTIDHDLAVRTHEGGLLESPEAARIMAERARQLSSRPAAESVLLVAHGMGSERDNDEVLGWMDDIASVIAVNGFAEVERATLREDWADARAASEESIRHWVVEQQGLGRRVLVLPARLSGFGPYAEVLDGLAYTPGDALLPHPEVSTWIRRTARGIICAAGWDPAPGSCVTVAASPAPR